MSGYIKRCQIKFVLSGSRLNELSDDEKQEKIDEHQHIQKLAEKHAKLKDLFYHQKQDDLPRNGGFEFKEKSDMSFLKKVQSKKTIVHAEDGPAETGIPSGASNPQNWVTQLQTGKSAYEVKQDADKLHDIVMNWTEGALEAHHLFCQLMMNGGKNFEMHSPIIMKGLSREKLQLIAEICEKMLKDAPTV